MYKVPLWTFNVKSINTKIQNMEKHLLTMYVDKHFSGALSIRTPILLFKTKCRIICNLTTTHCGKIGV